MNGTMMDTRSCAPELTTEVSYNVAGQHEASVCSRSVVQSFIALFVTHFFQTFSFVYMLRIYDRSGT